MSKTEIARLNEELPDLLRAIPGLKKKTGNEWSGACPFCGGNDRFTVFLDNGRYMCRNCTPKGGNKIDFYCKKEDTDLKGLAAKYMRDTSLSNTKEKHTMDYTYLSADGEPFMVVSRYDKPNGEKRYHPKRFDGKKVAGMKDHIPYNLPDVLGSERIFIPEGEKCCDALKELGLTATTNPNGAGLWQDNLNQYFKDKDVIILQDNDNPGHEHTKKIIKGIKGVAQSIKVIKLPGLPKAGDIVDWLEAGGTKEQLLELVAQEAELESAPAACKGSQADTMTALAFRNIDTLFVDQYKVPHAAIICDGHREIWPVDGSDFQRWLQGLYYKTEGKACTADIIKTAVNTISAQAQFAGAGQIELNNRVAWLDSELWYDLSNNLWQAVRITKNGWEVVSTPPILFRRYRNQQPQVTPATGGRFEHFLDFANLRRDQDKLLAQVWLLAALIPGFPHPISLLYGSQGSGKSFFFKQCKRLIDPGTKLTDSLPHGQPDLIKKLNNNYLTLLDNLSHIQPWVSDTLCRAVTGEGHSERQLYTNNEEVIISFQRVVGMNGINLVATQPDILDRSIIIELERISKEDRKREKQIDREFQDALPGIMGGVFDTLSKAIRIYPGIEDTLPELPRMADFTVWGYAIAEALGDHGDSFMKYYLENIRGQHLEVVHGSPLAEAVSKFMDGVVSWEGTAGELLTCLDMLAVGLHINTRNSAFWPQEARGLTRRLNVLKTNLAEIGIQVDTGIRKESGNFIRIGRNNSIVSSTASIKEPWDVTAGDNTGDIVLTPTMSPGLSWMSPGSSVRAGADIKKAGVNGDIFRRSAERQGACA